VENRELLRRMAADLAQLAAEREGPRMETDSKGRPFVRVDGVYMKLQHCVDPAVLSPETYIERIFNFFGCGPEVYIIALVYITRVLTRDRAFVMAGRDVNRLLLASIMLALKWHMDESEQLSDKEYARIGGVRIEELRQLEAHFVKRLDWELYVSNSEYANYRLLAMWLRFTKYIHIHRNLSPRFALASMAKAI